MSVFFDDNDEEMALLGIGDALLNNSSSSWELIETLTKGKKSDIWGSIILIANEVLDETKV